MSVKHHGSLPSPGHLPFLLLLRLQHWVLEQDHLCLAISVRGSQGSIRGLFLSSPFTLSLGSLSLSCDVYHYSVDIHICTFTLHSPLHWLCIYQIACEIQMSQMSPRPQAQHDQSRNHILPPCLRWWCNTPPVNGSTISPEAQVINLGAIPDSSPCTVHHQFSSIVLSKYFQDPSSFLYLHALTLIQTTPSNSWTTTMASKLDLPYLISSILYTAGRFFSP